MEIGEIAAAAAGDEDLFAGPRGALEDGDAAAAFSGFDGAQQAGGSRAENQCIVLVVHFVKIRAAQALSCRARTVAG